jgi:hypothetical protein
LPDGGVLDVEKRELRILGRRCMAIDAQAFCDYLDSLVGSTVGEVEIRSLQFRLGRNCTERIRSDKPQASTQDIVDLLVESDRVSGSGMTKVTLSLNGEGRWDPVLVEISNPSVKGTEGAAKAYLMSWWAGALTPLLGTDLDAREIIYSEKENVMRCRLVPRSK